MKNTLLCVPALALGMALTPALQDDPPAEDENVKMIAELQERVTALEEAAKGNSAAAGELLKALSESEAAGFTAGINPRSREVLLSGLRSVAQAAKDGASAKKKEEDSDERRGKRRGR